jgi:hypothetical protein
MLLLKPSSKHGNTRPGFSAFSFVNPGQTIYSETCQRSAFNEMKLPLAHFLRPATIMLCTGLAAISGPVPIHASEAVSRPSAQPEETVVVSIRSSSSSEFRSSLRIDSSEWSRWVHSWKPAPKPDNLPPFYELVEVSIEPSGRNKEYVWTNAGSLANDSEAYRIPEKMESALREAAEALHHAHFGKLVEWPEASRLIPRGAYITITDLETGLSFRGQRRAGSAHADVQPLTKKDSAIMKQIYGGHWSWNRRAVLVSSPEGPLAGSMHGMPHGGDGIPGNDFKGHFCIHFKGTITHGSSQSDPAHQAMVHKAAGELQAYHKTLTPGQVAELFLVASNQKDTHLMSLLLKPDSPHREALLQEWLNPSLKSARMLDKEPEEEPASDEQAAALKTRVSTWRSGSRSQTLHLNWTFSRSAPGDAWVIDNLELNGARK